LRVGGWGWRLEELEAGGAAGWRSWRRVKLEAG
jgi:hypothetical protein